MVMPLRRMDQFLKVKLPVRLTPVFNILGHDYLLETPKMGAFPQRELKDCITSLDDDQARITAAMDFLFQGY